MDKKIVSLDSLTPEDVEEHMQDDTWSQILEDMIGDLLKDSDTKSMERAYALTSMFIQTGYVSVLHGQLVGDYRTLAQATEEYYKKASAVRNALAGIQPDSEALAEYDSYTHPVIASANDN